MVLFVCWLLFINMKYSCRNIKSVLKMILLRTLRYSQILSGALWYAQVHSETLY